MALNYYYGDVKDKDELFHPEGHPREGYMKAFAEMIFMGTLSVGMNRIKNKEEAKKYFIRARYVNALSRGNGPFTISRHDSEKDEWVSEEITLGQCERMIGMSTNADKWTDNQFAKKAWEVFKRDSEARIKRETKKLQVASK